ncbi:MAG: hypothetical protein ABR497_08055 [Kiritimatiellia bacterium]|nr:hypothetical protein [Lentisphaerota bacterium]
MRWIYLLVGLLLVPLCMAATCTMAAMLTTWLTLSDPAQRIAMLALGCGICIWLIIWALLPAPGRSYVLAHELTHAIWGMLTGARLSGMRVTHRDGYVKLSESNVLTALAPYFMPFYTLLLLLLMGVSSWFFDLHKIRLIWLLLIGASIGFHFSRTIQVLSRQQSDLRAYGTIFPYTAIYLLNLAWLMLLSVWLSGMAPEDWTARLAHDWHGVLQMGRQAITLVSAGVSSGIGAWRQ